MRDFALGALTTAIAFMAGIWLYQKGVIKITPANKTASAPAGGNTPPSYSPSTVPSVSPTTTRQVQPQKPKIDPGAELYKEAMRYYNGGDVLQDYTKAVELLIQASEKGSAEADGELASIFWNGDANQERNRAKAISYANKAGSRKTQLAHQVLGLSYLFGEENVQQQDFKLAYSELSNATDYYYCRFLVGLMRYHGVGTIEDKKGAAEVFFSLCKKGVNDQSVGMAALCLGYMYVKGEGVGQNVPEGVSWMKWGIKASKRDFLKPKATGYQPDYMMYLTMKGLYGVGRDEWPGGMTLLTYALEYYFDKGLFRP
jgi:TPR repeat protein